MARTIAAIVAIASGLACCALSEIVVPQTAVGFNVVRPDGFTAIRQGLYNGTLYQVVAKGSMYKHAPYLLDMHGTRYQHGFDAGFTQIDMANMNYDRLLKSVLAPAGVLEPEAQWLLEEFVDWQWNEFLSQQLPEVYKEEAQGLHDGCQAALTSTPWGRAFSKNNTYIPCDVLWNRIQVLANFPGTITDLKYVLANEFNITLDKSQPSMLRSSSQQMHRLRELVNASPVGQKASQKGIDLFEFITNGIHFRNPMQCSMLAAWGPRTENGQLFSGRNLDWNQDTGINRYKTIYVFHPPGKNAHAIVGFAGLMGALTGMSASGLTVHEANLEESPETFLGFPWTMRLRYIMENADSIASAQNLWMDTNNTVGFNHMVGSAHDAAAMVFETQAGYTAYFRANDPREANAIIDGVHTGFPIKNALWRTNHGYDPRIVKDYLWSQGPSTDTQHRYMIIHDAIVNYESNNQLMGFLEAINVTSLAGQKGDNYYVCGNTHSGTNVLSVAYKPLARVIYAAWEAFSGPQWRPAACNSYIEFDMTQWF